VSGFADALCTGFEHVASVTSTTIVPLSTDVPIWSRVHTVAPLVLVGTVEDDGAPDVAPKHMAMPLGWQNRFCFVCSPRHATYRNAVARRIFTVSFPTPAQVVQASLAAGGRADDASKPSVAAVPTFPSRVVEGVLVEGCYLWLECELEQVLDGFGENSLVIGRVVAAAADERAVRDPERDDADLLRDSPLLAYLAPGRFATIDDTKAFPLPVDFRL
jgi:flavin reductase (DIM6/NTAB) family NADH-FMN oxidoreductase RutF